MDGLEQQGRLRASDAKEIYGVSEGTLLGTPETLSVLGRSELDPTQEHVTLQGAVGPQWQ